MSVQRSLLTLATLGLLAACSPAPQSQSIEVVVYKSATCACCVKWADHLRDAGFSVTTENVADLSWVKREYGIEREFASCHTAIVDGYVVEGHVPADVVQRLLEERPAIVGLTVPGMPIGSPGMEGPNPEHYEILSFDREGRTEVYARR